MNVYFALFVGIIIATPINLLIGKYLFPIWGMDNRDIIINIRAFIIIGALLNIIAIIIKAISYKHKKTTQPRYGLLVLWICLFLWIPWGICMGYLD